MFDFAERYICVGGTTRVLASVMNAHIKMSACIRRSMDIVDARRWTAQYIESYTIAL